MRIFPFSFSLIILFAFFVPDVVILKNGARFEGRVTKKSEKKVAIEIDGGVLEFPMRQVKEVICRSPEEEKRNEPTARKKQNPDFPGGKKKQKNQSPRPKKKQEKRGTSQPGQEATKVPTSTLSGPAAPILDAFEKDVYGKSDLSNDVINSYRDKLVSLGLQAIPDLTAVFTANTDWKVRYLSVIALRRMNHPSAIPALLEALKDDTVLQNSFNGWSSSRSATPWIRRSAAEGLKAIGAEARSALLEIIARKDHANYENAVYALGMMEDPEVVSLLIRIAEDHAESLPVRREAVRGIAGKGPDAACTIALLLKDERLREDAAAAMRKRKDQAAIPALAYLITEASTHFEASKTAAELLSSMTRGKWKSEKANETVDFLLLRSKSSSGSIARVMGKAALSRLTFWARSGHSEMCLRAIEGLKGFDEKGVNDELLRLVEHRDKDVRFKAISALAAKRDHRAIEPLIRSLDSDRSNRIMLLRLLRSWTGQNFRYDTARWLKWWQENKQTFIQ